MDKALENSLSLGLLKTEPLAIGDKPAPVAEPVTDAHELGLGVDSACNLPWLADTWSEPFYVENFPGAEMSQRLHRPDASPNHA